MMLYIHIIYILYNTYTTRILLYRYIINKYIIYVSYIDETDEAISCSSL